MSILSPHIPFVHLVDLVEGRLPPGEQAECRSHLSTCARCRDEVAWLERVTSLMRTDDQEDAPPHVIARAARLLPPRRPTVAVGIPRLLAALLFDSAQPLLAAGVRAGPSAERQLLYTADELDLDLRVTQADAQWSVSGQVLGRDVAGEVELKRAGIAVRAPLSELSEFRLPPVDAGTYTLTLLMTDEEIVVEGLEIGA